MFDKNSVREVLKEMGLNLSDQEVEVIYLSFSLDEFSNKLNFLYGAIGEIEEKLEIFERLYLNGSISKKVFKQIKDELELPANFLASTIFNESLISEYILWAAKDWEKKNSKNLDIFYTSIDAQQCLAFFNMKNLYNLSYSGVYVLEKRDEKLEEAYLNITKFQRYKRPDIVNFYQENLEKFRRLYNKEYSGSIAKLRIKEYKKNSDFFALTDSLEPYMPIVYNFLVSFSFFYPQTAVIGIFSLIKEVYNSFKQQDFKEASLNLTLAIFSSIPYLGNVKSLTKLSKVLSYPSKIVGGYLIFENFSMLLDKFIDWSKYGVDEKELLAAAPALFFCRVGKRGKRVKIFDEYLKRYPPGPKRDVRFILEVELGFKGPAKGQDTSTKYKVEGSLKDGTVYGRVLDSGWAIAFIATPDGKIYTYFFNNVEDWHRYLQNSTEETFLKEIQRAETKGTPKYIERGKSKDFILYM